MQWLQWISLNWCDCFVTSRRERTLAAHRVAIARYRDSCQAFTQPYLTFYQNVVRIHRILPAHVDCFECVSFCGIRYARMPFALAADQTDNTHILMHTQIHSLQRITHTLKTFTIFSTPLAVVVCVCVCACDGHWECNFGFRGALLHVRITSNLEPFDWVECIRMQQQTKGCWQR